MKPIRKYLAVFLILSLSLLAGIFIPQDVSASESSSESYSRLAGETRYQTSKAVAENFNNDKVDNIVLATGNDYADALSVSVLAGQLDAPILLVNHNTSQSQDALDYISKHMPKGKVWISGSTGVVDSSFESKLKAIGYSVERVAGVDRYETCLAIAEKENVPRGTPVFLVTGNNFPDALSIASVAASKGYPIILTPKNSLPNGIENYLLKQQPSEIFIIGSTGAVSESVESTVRAILPAASVTRIAGKDRFETSSEVYKKFFSNPDSIYIASGMNFPDALSASVLAAKNDAPIVLINPKYNIPPVSIFDYLKSLTDLNITAIGSTGVVPVALADNIKDILDNVSPSATNYYTLSSTTTSNSTVSFSCIVSPGVKDVGVHIKSIISNCSNVYVPQNRLVSGTLQLEKVSGTHTIAFFENGKNVKTFAVKNTADTLISSNYESITLTADEQKMINLVNQERQRVGCKPLKVDKNLVALARLKSQDMIDKNYFGHQSPTYGSPFDMMKSAGVTYRRAGENIAGASSVERAHQALMDSDGHRANILKPEYTHIGIGIIKGGPYGMMFTQMFIG